MSGGCCLWDLVYRLQKWRVVCRGLGGLAFIVGEDVIGDLSSRVVELVHIT